MTERRITEKFFAFETGCLTRTALTESGNADIVAVFERSIYLRNNQGYLCLGPAALGSGPLNMRCHFPPDWDWRAHGVKAGAYVSVRDRHLRFRSGFALCFAGAAIWTPSPPRIAGLVLVRAGLAALTDLMVDRVPQAGLGQLALRSGILAHAESESLDEAGVTQSCSGTADPFSSTSFGTAGSGAVIAAAVETAGTLDRLLHAALVCGAVPRNAAVHRLRALIGLGPGLTPSGDDYLGGALIALRLVGEHPLANRLWRLLQPRLAETTNEISAAHLAAAAHGFGNDALHALLADLLGGRCANLQTRLAAVDAIGHTSGWDALAGALGVLRVWLRAQSLSGRSEQNLETQTLAQERKAPPSLQRINRRIDARTPVRIDG